MVDELANEGGARRLSQIVRVVDIQGGIHDQGGGCGLASVAQLVPGVQDAAGLADVPHCSPQGRRVVTEKRIQVGEHTTKPVLADRRESGAPRLGMSGSDEKTA